jgi:hypothetical protein
MIFNEILPEELRQYHQDKESGQWILGEGMKKKQLGKLVANCFNHFGATKTAEVIDNVKNLGYHYACVAGMTVAISDVIVPPQKKTLIADTQKVVNKVERQFARGLISEDERYRKVVGLWSKTTDDVADAMMDNMDAFNPIFMMADSGARGNKQQMRQLAGMRGLMADPSGKIIEWFEHLGKGISHQHSMIEDIQDDLEGNDDLAEGGFLCIYPVFQGIYRSNRRLIDRTGTSSCLMLCTILDGKGNPMKEGTVLDRLSERLIESACCSVRRGDTICSYGKGQCLILLVNTTREDCAVVQQRINKNFIVGRQRISIKYDIRTVSPDEKAAFRKSS